MIQLYKHLFIYRNQEVSLSLNQNVLTQLSNMNDVKMLIQFIQLIHQEFTYRQYNKHPHIIINQSTQSSNSNTINQIIQSQPIGEITQQQPIQITKPQIQQQQPQDIRFTSIFNELKVGQMLILIKRLSQLRKKFKDTIYSLRLHEVIVKLKKNIGQRQQLSQMLSIKKQLEDDRIGDFDIKQEDYLKYVAGLNLNNNLDNKINEIIKSPYACLGGKFNNYSSHLKFTTLQIIPVLQKQILNIPLHHHKERQSQIYKALQFINKIYVAQYQLQIQINKNTIVQTRIYNNKLLKKTLLLHQNEIISAIKKICNEAILCPSNNGIQILLLRVLRRLYCLHDYQADLKSQSKIKNSHKICHISQIEENIASKVRNPLFLTIRNIALFGGQTQEDIKQAAMLCYKILYDKNDIQLIQLLQNCDELRLIKHSKYYSSKAYAYPDQICKIYQPHQIPKLYVKQHRIIPPRQLWTINILIQKPSSLLSWEFYIAAYDIKFGIFKVDGLKELTLQDYDNHVNCKQVLRFQKVRNGQNVPHVGHLYLKNGLYRLVFDNSFSMIRSKQIFYSLQHLQSRH